MKRLTLNGRPQTVTSIVTCHDQNGHLHILLGRSDPRYKDKDGAYLTGSKLAVGPCKFIGGKVEADIDIQWLDQLEQNNPQFNQLPAEMDRRIAANAMKELVEEVTLLIDSHLQADARMHHVQTITRPARGMGVDQDIHYINIHLGTMTTTQMQELQHSIRPRGDMMQTVFAATQQMHRDDNGDVIVNLHAAKTTLKISFGGFPDRPDYCNSQQHFVRGLKLANCSETTSPAMDYVYVAAQYNRLYGLYGIDRQSVRQPEVNLFRPSDPTIPADGDVLQKMLKEHYDLTLKPSVKNLAALVGNTGRD